MLLISHIFQALFVVKGLQTEIQKSKEEQHQKVNKMKEKTKEKEEKWDGVSCLVAMVISLDLLAIEIFP